MGASKCVDSGYFFLPFFLRATVSERVGATKFPVFLMLPSSILGDL